MKPRKKIVTNPRVKVTPIAFRPIDETWPKFEFTFKRVSNSIVSKYSNDMQTDVVQAKTKEDAETELKRRHSTNGYTVNVWACCRKG